MRFPALSLLLTTGLVGCAPHDGEVTGDYLVYLDQGSSLNINDIRYNRRIDLGVQENLDRFGLTPIDCRNLAEEDEGQRVPLADTSACVEEAYWFWWFNYYPFYKKEGKIEPTRVEALLTSENDLQLTVHMNVPRFGDVRFGWVVDPRFQPKICVTDDAGNATLEDVDGNWLENWSADEGGATLFNLNQGAYQTNPASVEDYWFIEQDWLGGDSFGRFVDDDFYGHPTDYTDTYDFPIYLHTYDNQAQGGAVGTLPQSNFDYADWITRIREDFAFSADNPSDIMTMGQSEFPLEVKIEDNSWRISDEEAELEDARGTNVAYGLENWVGINTSWVKIDLTPEQVGLLETGKQDKPITGSFQITLDGLASASKLLVNGTFTIDTIRADVWGYPETLDSIKREENNTPECGDNRTNIDG